MNKKHAAFLSKAALIEDILLEKDYQKLHEIEANNFIQSLLENSVRHCGLRAAIPRIAQGMAGQARHDAEVAFFH